ncbi:MAG: D-alanyl-D-alanine carboxypeptidase [Candidatus Nealsonbacteria bacterium]|nr:D-alanyl-D-alanine carboxypeptidase [Candidatus Nealsonbacteria bacterium]
MTKNLKYLVILFLLSLPGWWGINILKERSGNFFYWLEMAKNPVLLAAEARQVSFQNHINELKPIHDENIPDLEIGAKSAISILVDNQGKERVLFEKEEDVKLPIASLTKLMTVKIVLDNYDLSKEIKISEEAISQEENFGKLTAGKALSVNYLLYPLLMESSNDAAFALANDYDGMTIKKFIQLMNQESGKLKLTDTKFFNPTGLDPEKPDQDINYSTASDLAELTKDLLPYPLLWEVLSTPKLDIYGPELVNTNELLGKIPNILGGKTGYTEKALGCFILVTKAPKDKGYIINVILGANGVNSRFQEMEKLINWLGLAYSW